MLICEQLIAVLSQIEGGPNRKSADYFGAIWGDIDGSAAQYRLLKLFEDAEEELNIAPIKEEIRERQLSRLKGSRISFFNALNSTSSSEFQARFNVSVVKERMQGIADVLNTVGLPPRLPLNRPGFVKETLTLCEEIKESNIPDYAKKVAVLKIEALIRVVSEGSTCSDDDIRLRVKAVFADFCAEFDRFDKQHAELLDSVKAWAKRAAGVGVFALALSADVSEVAGLLTGPQADTSTESQSGQ